MVGGFEVGAVPFNPDGWGPPEYTVAAAAAANLPLNVPFAPFSRSDKLGRIADFTRNFNNQTRPKNPSDSVFDFSNDDSFPASGEDDSSFRLVDGKPPPRPKFGPKWRFQQQRQLPQRRDEEVEARKREAEKERARRDRLYHLNRSNANAPRREAAVFKSSVDIQPEWNMLDQIPFSTFSKLSFSVPEPEDLLLCGGLEFYDRAFDRITPKNERRLERFKNRNFFKVTTTDDPVIRRLANEDKATGLATDTILSTLMCAPRSVYSWDIVIQRVGNKLFFDKRDGSQLDLLSVHETSQEPLPEAKDDINSAYSLSVEAAYINQNFSQQVTTTDDPVIRRLANEDKATVFATRRGTCSTRSPSPPSPSSPSPSPSPEPEDFLLCGGLGFYDCAFDRITPKNERRLERFKNRNFFKVTTTDDPVIRRLANEDKATVFAIDAILSTLMCAPRSVYSWDIVIQRVGNKLFFDKRDGSQLDLLSVHETSQEPLPEANDDINSAYSLSVEAAYINQNFFQQVLIRDGNKVTFDLPNPFANEGEEVASVAYRYRGGSLTTTCIWWPGARFRVLLRQKLETQRGAVLATELKNNANKLAKWTAQALLSSADLMKLGYVSRVHPRDHFNHVILAVVGYKPRDFAAQINLNTSNMWGIVKSIVDLCMKLNEGKYVLLKDPSKPQVRIYEVPADAFENDYGEEPLPEEEQVQPPVENAEGEANAASNDVEDKQIDAEA
ncbi:Eukaryotic translation initiation factor 3 subunit D [Morus notabilis]|uniref:Eukaryotic translation initiation factor 3 subunit D n=1 Tax=Morus notabilis TaxID=981085 RepID=W9QEF0_9ROSA|nr:Eukaryotic translation initiation factor 3 subunit D [Morus notabilis]